MCITNITHEMGWTFFVSNLRTVTAPEQQSIYHWKKVQSKAIQKPGLGFYLLAIPFKGENEVREEVCLQVHTVHTIPF